MLANHVQSIHGDLSEDSRNNQTSNGLDNRRTDESPSLEKPFQCPDCNKCFAEYTNLSKHIDHYHGFKRACNIVGCDKVSSSVLEFVQHYAHHADPTFEVPEEHKSKTKALLPCPTCSRSIQVSYLLP